MIGAGAAIGLQVERQQTVGNVAGRSVVNLSFGAARGDEQDSGADRCTSKHGRLHDPVSRTWLAYPGKNSLVRRAPGAASPRLRRQHGTKHLGDLSTLARPTCGGRVGRNVYIWCGAE